MDAGAVSYLRAGEVCVRETANKEKRSQTQVVCDGNFLLISRK